MRNPEIFGHIARKYLDAYSILQNCSRPLSPEQVKDASVLLMDLMEANEMDAMLANEGRKSKADQDAPLRAIAALFSEAYLDRQGDAAPKRITPDVLDDIADTFRNLLDEHFGA